MEHLTLKKKNNQQHLGITIKIHILNKSRTTVESRVVICVRLCALNFAQSFYADHHPPPAPFLVVVVMIESYGISTHVSNVNNLKELPLQAIIINYNGLRKEGWHSQQQQHRI